MFKTSRKRVVAGKEKLDFKFEFHVSQVPQRGWDKLLVSLISLESGKVTAKTGKVSVKNGNCHWSEPLYESATVSQDLKGKYADRLIYRLVVSMGLSRFGVLGETTINLADHLQAIVPVSLSLPLQNCNVGSMLHVKVQRIMPDSVSRHTGALKESASEQDSYAGKTDSLHAGFDSMLHGAQILDKSQHNKIEKDASLSTSSKEDTFSPLTHRYSTDSLEIPSTPGVSESRRYARDPLGEEPMSPSSSVSSGSGRQESGRGFNEYIGFKRTQINLESTGELKLGESSVSHSLSSVQASLDGNENKQMEQWNSHPLSVRVSPGNVPSNTISCAAENWEKLQEKDQKSIHLQSSNLDAAEMTIRELRTEAASREQYGKELETEIEALKQQLADESRRTVELQTQLTALVAERDSIKLDIENLKSSEKSSSKIGEDVVWQQVEDSRRTVRELQDELEYEKSMNSNLNLQLQKTQESNSQLLLEIQDLEKVQAEKRELEKALTEKREFEKRGVRESGHTNGDSEKIIAALKKELEELERDSQELTEENLGLLAEVKQANDRLNVKDGIIAKLEEENKVLLEQSPSSTGVHKVNDSMHSADSEESKLRRMVSDLGEKLRISEESAGCKLASSRTLVDDLNSSVVMLRSKNARLERQLQSSEENVSGLLKEIDTLKSNSDEHEREKSLLVSQRGQLKGLREKAMKAEQDYFNILTRCEELETMNQILKEEKRKAIDSLDQQLHSSEAQALDMNKRYADCLQVVEDLKLQKLKSEQEMTRLLKAKEDAAVTVIQLQETNVQIQERLQQEQLKNSQLLLENQENDAKSVKLLQELYACQNEVKKMEQNTKDLETLRNEMEITVQGIQEEKRHSRSQIKKLELQIAALNDNNQFLQDSRSALEAKNHDLQSLNDELCKKLENVREESTWARENTNSLLKEIRSLEAELESGSLRRSEMEHSVSALEAENINLQSQLQNLSKEKLLLQGKVVDYEAQFRNATEEKEALMISMQDKENVGKENEAALQTMIKEQQEKIKQLQAEIWVASSEAEDGKTVMRNLSLAIENLKDDLASKESTKMHNEEEVQKLRLQITMLNDELHKLCSDFQEKEKRLSGEIQVLLLSNQELQTRAETTEELLNSSYREKALAVERLQQEIQQLSHQLSTNCDDKEKVAMQASKDALVLQAEKEDLERKVFSLQQMLKQANKDALSLKETLEFKVNEAVAKESQAGKKLEEVIREIDVLKMENLSYTQRMVELEGKCTTLEELNESTAAQISKCQSNVWQNECWQKETEKARDALALMKEERMKVEASFKEALEELSMLKKRMKSQEEAANQWKLSKAALDDKISSLQEESARFVKNSLDEKNESNKLCKQTSDLKHKLSEQEMQREELKRSVTALEEELKQKTSALCLAEKKLKDRELSANGSTPVSLLSRSLSRSNSKVGPMSPSRDAKELTDLRQKVKLLEGEVKRKAMEVEASKRRLQEQHMQFSGRIEALELANEQLVAKHSLANVDQLIKELTRLQDQNAALFQRENELLSKLSSQKILQNELESLKEEKKDLENALALVNAAAKGENVMKRVSVLETELAEVLEANNMYKLQLQSVFSKQHNVHAAALENLGSADKVVNDFAELKRKNENLEDELKDMRQRYFNMSLQFAEVEAEREELVMTIRNIRGTRKLMPFWSANFQRDNANF